MKRIAIFAFDVVGLLLVSAALSFAFVKPAYAYVDPSVMTYAIQAFAGVAVALSTVLGVVFRRTRKKLFRVLGIDENARKDVDPRLHRVDASGDIVRTKVDEVIVRNAAVANGSARGHFDYSLKTRIGLAAIVSGFLSFTLCFAAPAEIVSSSAGSLVVRLVDVLPVIVGMFLLVWILLAAVACLFKKRAFAVVVAVVFSVALSCYAQALFMNVGLPQADGGVVNWDDYTTITALSAAAWIALIAVSIVAVIRYPRKAQMGFCLVALALVAVQGAGVASLFVGESGASNVAGRTMMVSEKGLLDVSAKTNVVEFVLDNYDTALLEQAVSEEPEMFDGFEGFTWFKDSAGSMIPTRYGNVFLLTGVLPREDEPFSAFLANRYARSPYLSDIREAGYDIGVYSDTLGEQYLSADEAIQHLYRYTSNIAPLDRDAMDVPATAASLLRCALYRDLPWLAKPLAWFYTDEVNRSMFGSGRGASDKTPYLMDDGSLLSRLRTEGLSTNDQDASYRYIHVIGAHDPFSLDRNGEEVGVGNSNPLDQAIGSMKIVETYINELKRLGVYDQTTVIVTTDHGSWWCQEGEIDQPKSPIVLFKPAASVAAGSDKPFAVSESPVSAGDILATMEEAVGAPNFAFFGESLADKVGDGSHYRKGEQTRYFYMTTSDGVHDQKIQKYAIKGDARDLGSWSRTNVEWDAQS